MLLFASSKAYNLDCSKIASFFGVVLLHFTAMLQSFSVCKHIASIRCTVELRREALVVDIGGKVIIIDKDT